MVLICFGGCQKLLFKFKHFSKNSYHFCLMCSLQSHFGRGRGATPRIHSRASPMAPPRPSRTVKGSLFPLVFGNPGFPRIGPRLSLVLPCFLTTIPGGGKVEFHRGKTAFRAIAKRRPGTPSKRLPILRFVDNSPRETSISPLFGPVS